MTQSIVAGRLPVFARHAPLDVPRMTVILGGAAVGAWVGYQLGGPQGSAVAACVGTVIASVAALAVKRVRVRFTPKGEVIVDIEWAV